MVIPTTTPVDIPPEEEEDGEEFDGVEDGGLRVPDPGGMGVEGDGGGGEMVAGKPIGGGVVGGGGGEKISPTGTGSGGGGVRSSTGTVLNGGGGEKADDILYDLIKKQNLSQTFTKLREERRKWGRAVICCHLDF